MNPPLAFPRRLLFADDDPLVLRSFGALLVKWGWEVITAPDGNAALELLRGDNPPRLAILDWGMPKVDGLEVCRLARELRPSDPPYLILLTGRGGHDDLIEGLEGGADDYLAKPIDPDELRVRLQAAWRLVELHAGLNKRVRELEELPLVNEIVGEDNPGIRQTLRLCAATFAETLALPGVPRSLRTALRTCRGLCLQALGDSEPADGQV